MNTSETSPFGTSSSVSFELTPYLWFAFATLVTAGVYIMGLHGPLLLDDFVNLYGLMQSGDAGTPFPELLTRFGISESGPLGRPVSMLSFAISAALFGSDVYYWKLTNVIIHCGNGILLYLLLKSLFNRIPRLQKNANTLTFFICAIWLANPAQLSSVLYTIQRMNLLAAFFTLLCLLCYVRGKEQFFVSDKVPRYVAAAGSFLLAIFSKENALLTLGFIVLIEIYFFDGMNRLRQSLTPQQLKSGRYALALIGISLFAMFYFSYSDNYGHRNFTIGERLITEPRVIMLYIYQWLIPVPSNLPFFYDDFEVSTSLFSPFTTILSIAAVAALVWFAYQLRHLNLLISAGIAWFLLGHSMEAGFIPLHLMFEHRNYLPSVGISIILVYALMSLDIKPIVRDVSMIAYLLFLVFLLAIRADMWNDEDVLYTSLLRYRPHSEDLLSANANLLISKKKYNEARQLLSTKTTPATLLHTAYIQCMSQGKVNVEDLETITRMTQKPISSYWTSAATNLVNYALSDGCKLPEVPMDNLLAKGAASYGIPSQHYLLLLYRAHWARKNQHLEKAYALLDELTETHRSATPFFLRAEWLLDDQQTAEAIQSLADGKKRAGDDIPLYRELIDNLEKRLSAG